MTEDNRLFAKFYDEVIVSDAWRSAGINVRRIVDFLMHEHIHHGFKQNGLLLAPYEQLAAFGVGARYAADAIRAAEELGLIECNRPGLKKASLYALTWFDLHDGTAATNRFREYRNPALKPLPTPKPKPQPQNLPVKGKVELPVKGKVDAPKQGKSTRQREGRLVKNLPVKGKALSRISYQDGDISSVVEGMTGRYIQGHPTGSTSPGLFGFGSVASSRPPRPNTAPSARAQTVATVSPRYAERGDASL